MTKLPLSTSAVPEKTGALRRWQCAWRARAAGMARPLRWQWVLVLASTALFLLIWLAPPQHYGFEGIASYTWLHMMLETPSLLVAGMVFGVAWNAYSRERPGNIMLLAIGLLATGLIDFVHTLSFKGMPDFISPSDPEKAINFWLAARFIFAAMLATVALRPWAPLRRPATRHVVLGATLTLAALVIWFGLLHQQAMPRTFIAGQGLTAFKIDAEYLIVALLLVPAVIFLHASRGRPQYDAPSLFAAAAMSILSELCFTLYSDVTDIFNLLGHVYKVVAFGMIYRAVFIGSVREPFERVVEAEGRMRAASFYVRSLIEASVDPLFMISPEGRITDVNRAAEEVTRRGREQLIGADFGACFTEPEQARASFQAMLSTGLVRDRLLTIRSAGGDCTEVLFNATAYRNAAGRVEGIVAAARDFTEIRRAQQTLVRQHALLSKITETGPLGITVWDLSGHLTFANREAEKLLARPHDQIAALSFNSPDWDITDFAGVPLADADLPFNRVKASGQPVYNLQMAVIGPLGTRTLLSVSAAPLLDAAGQIEGVVAMLDDVTQRRAADARLRASEARLKIAMTAARMGAWSWDLEHDSLLYSNEFSSLMGLPHGISHASFKAVLEAVHPDDRERVGATLRRAEPAAASDGWLDFRIVWPDASVHWLSTHGSVERDGAGKAVKVSGLGMDITERKSGELALKRVNRALRSLSAANDRLIHEQDEAGLLNAVCRVIVDVGGYRMAWVGKALQDADKNVQCLAQYGGASDFIERVHMVWSDCGHSTTGDAIRTGLTQVNQNTALNDQVTAWREEALKHGYQSSIAFPLRDIGGVHAALTIYAAEADAFDADEVKLLQELADDLAFGIVTLRTVAERDRMAQEQHHHEARLHDSLIESIQALATTLELRDPYTAGHQRRVAALAKAIGQEIGLSEVQLQGMHLAASTHDIGKIHIPSEILNKPGRLSPIEMEMIRTHATVGYDILKDISFPWPIARIVHEHHEHLDGSGYPNHLSGEHILLESKIVTVADVVEAMTSHRPYRPGLGIDAALQHITECSGTWYQPEVVEACLKLFREGRYSFEAATRKADA